MEYCYIEGKQGPYYHSHYPEGALPTQQPTESLYFVAESHCKVQQQNITT